MFRTKHVEKIETQLLCSVDWSSLRLSRYIQ